MSTKLDFSVPDVLPMISTVISWIFSSLISMALGVIVSGKLLGRIFNNYDNSCDLFAIKVSKYFELTATSAEVSLGFGLYFFVFFNNLLFFGDLLQDRMTKIAGLPIESGSV